MRDVASKAMPIDDRWMPRRPKSDYAPPKDFKSVLLSQALRNTNRLPDSRQLHFLGHGSEGRSDIPLFVAGNVSLLERPCAAIVGTREVSEAGRARTTRLARELVDAGVVIVSGLAYGVDTVAHETAIQHGGDTIAVIGTPLDKASPSENARLQERIYREHLLISRFPIGERTFRGNFPLRNRLMAILSDCTVVMEASDTSGTLHQAAECTRLGRWLFIAKSVVDDRTLSWPGKFLKYETCLPLERVSQITDRIVKSSQ